MVRTRSLSIHARAVLAALLDAKGGWSHGYDLARLAGIKSGTLYPLLMRLESQGYLEAEWQQPAERGRPPRHAYRLTPSGVQLALSSPPERHAPSARRPEGDDMTLRLRRRLTDLTCDVLECALPPELTSWGRAIRHEAAEIPNDGGALRFAIGGLSGLAPEIVAFHLRRALAALSPGDMSNMRYPTSSFRDPRRFGIACAIGAVLLGLAYMATAGAPITYLGINLGALVLGLAAMDPMARMARGVSHWPGAVTLMISIALLATALLGDRVDDAARWVHLGPLFIQPSLILIPAMIVGFARSRHALSMLGIIISAAALALQPDRAMAGSLAAALLVLAVMRPDHFAVPAAFSGVIAFAVTLARADTLPAMPYVDQILYSAFEVHALAGLAVLGGSILLLVPAVVGWLYDRDNRETHLVFGTVWLGMILAAALGNYPTPVVGYSGGAILGYVVSLITLPAAVRGRRTKFADRERLDNQPKIDRELRVEFT